MLNRPHPKCIFRKTIFRPIGDFAPPKFFRALENDQVLLAHPPPWAGALLTTFFKGESIIGLKCNKGPLITSELGGVT